MDTSVSDEEKTRSKYMKDTAKKYLPLLIILAVMAAFLVPKRLQERAANQFGEPLFSHALPEGAKLIQQDAAKERIMQRAATAGRSLVPFLPLQ